MKAATLQRLERIAGAMGLILVPDHIGSAEGWWLEDPKTGEGPLDGDNFSTTAEEIEDKLKTVQKGLQP